MSEINADDVLELVETRGRWEYLLVELMEVLGPHFAREGNSPEVAERLAASTVMTIARHMGGRYFYLPRGSRIENALRDERIFAAHERGAAMDVLVKRHGICHERVRQIVRRQQAIRYKLQQDDLFD